jgi:hypothetical protein
VRPSWDDLFAADGKNVPPSKRHRFAGESTINHREAFLDGPVSLSGAIELANWPTTIGETLAPSESPLVRKTDA